MREYTVDELAQFTLEQLYDIKQAMSNELYVVQNKRGLVIADIIEMQHQIQQAQEDAGQ